MTYREAIDAILALEHRGWRLGLDRMQEFCRRANLDRYLGAPSGPKFIHVAGTNGKGSTTAFLESVMIEAGHQTGAFFSPYVVDYRERIQLNGQPIPEQDLANLTAKLLAVADELTPTPYAGITKFEFEAALGFLYWGTSRCDWVALEVGLGGRLDATNVVHPSACVIVSIGLDHVNVLGDTIEKIASEKAGIIKSGVPVIVGEMAESAVQVIKAKAREQGAPVWRFGKQIKLDETPDGYTVTTPLGGIAGLCSGLVGSMQPHNAALAVAAVLAAGTPAGPDAIRRGIAMAFAPGRFQRVEYGGCEILLDGAHNGQAAQALRKSLDREYPNRPLHLVTNMLGGHDPELFYRELMDRVVSVQVVPVDFVRARTPEETAAFLAACGKPVVVHDSAERGLSAACENALADGGLVLVTGSNYVVGDVARLPGVTSVQ